MAACATLWPTAAGECLLQEAMNRVSTLSAPSIFAAAMKHGDRHELACLVESSSTTQDCKVEQEVHHLTALVEYINDNTCSN